MYQAKTAWNKALLMRCLVNMKLKSGTSVAEHTSEFQSLVNQLSCVEMPLGDKMQSLLLLSYLPDSGETLVVTLKNSASNGKLSMSVFKDALYNDEARRKDMGTNQTHALVVENRGRPQGKQQRSGRGNSRGRSKGRQSDDRRSHVCYHCGLEGHMKKNFYKWLEEQGKSNSQSKNSSQQKNKGKSGETLITVSVHPRPQSALHDADQTKLLLSAVPTSRPTTNIAQTQTSFKTDPVPRSRPASVQLQRPGPSRAISSLPRAPELGFLHRTRPEWSKPPRQQPSSSDP
ncbi:Unknown protein [Striga hermonthica]|uniref:CCHC-type domain-containing protein n=1 Tax=Striga hermonthica TaxID=68872 RepID=A0A9N7RNQ0_STRHE|nr:Unknown protein [Striga hermonthica]